MAVSIANKKRVAHESGWIRFVDITGPASYTTGGEALSAADLRSLTAPGYGRIGDIIGFFAEDSVAGHALALDRTNSKIMYWDGTTQIANAVNLSAVVVRVAVYYGFAQAV